MLSKTYIVGKPDEDLLFTEATFFPKEGNKLVVKTEILENGYERHDLIDWVFDLKELYSLQDHIQSLIDLLSGLMEEPKNGTRTDS